MGSHNEDEAELGETVKAVKSYPNRSWIYQIFAAAAGMCTCRWCGKDFFCKYINIFKKTSELGNESEHN